jgi:magnesium transporter
MSPASRCSSKAERRKKSVEMERTMPEIEGADQAASDLAMSPAADLARQAADLDPAEAARMLSAHPDATIVEVLQILNPSKAQAVLAKFWARRHNTIIAAASPELRQQWLRNEEYPEGSVGRLMEPAAAIFYPYLSVGEAIEQLRDLVKATFLTYAFVIDHPGKLLGVVVMRDLLFADGQAPLSDVMVANPFSLKPDMTLVDAMKLALNRHFPEYPVCDADGHLIGTVRGHAMFEAQAFEISAQAGSMVGVEKEERLATPWQRSLRLRHPWLQLNLLTAFFAGAVVSLFQGTIDQVVILAVFLPILAGQSGNTGCQALAVTLRGMTLGDLKKGHERTLVLKEGLLGLLNGSLVGVSAGIGMFILARMQDNPMATTLGAVVLVAMIVSCVISGISGALVPLALKSFGADPATASSIFLTTATDVVSMGLLLGLATLFLL